MQSPAPEPIADDRDRRVAIGSLEQIDRSALRSLAHGLLDACLDRFEADGPSGDRVPGHLPGDLHGLPEPPPLAGLSLDALAQDLVDGLLPHVAKRVGSHQVDIAHHVDTAHRDGAGVLAALVGATLRTSGDGLRHLGADLERRVIDWCASVHGLPETAGGRLVADPAFASALALHAARGTTLDDPAVPHRDASPRPTLYVAEDAAPAISRAVELTGFGAAACRALPLHAVSGSLSLDALDAAVGEDRAAGRAPICLVGVAGAPDSGRFDDLVALANAAEQHDLWLHVEGGSGAWAALADDPWRWLVAGLERADSMVLEVHGRHGTGAAFDPAAALLLRDVATLGAAGAGDGDEVRGALALSVWAGVRAHGLAALGAAFAEDCRQAASLGERISMSERLELVAPVVSTVCRFAVIGADDAQHRRIVDELRSAGAPRPSIVRVADRPVLRIELCSARGGPDDAWEAIEAVERVADAQGLIDGFVRTAEPLPSSSA